MDCHKFKINGIHEKTFYAADAVAWNKLPHTVRSSKTMNTFESRLDDHWNDPPIKYDHLAIPPWRAMKMMTMMKRFPNKTSSY